jgi:hypothetical protein
VQLLSVFTVNKIAPVHSSFTGACPDDMSADNTKENAQNILLNDCLIREHIGSGINGGFVQQTCYQMILLRTDKERK